MAASRGMTNRQMLMVGAIFVALVAAAFTADSAVAMWVRQSGLEHWVRDVRVGNLIATICKAPGSFWTASHGVFWTWLIPIAALCVWHPLKYFAGGFLALANLMGLVTDLLKWLIGRVRPFRLHEQLGWPEPFALRPLRGGLRGLFEQTNLAFPSGHATTAFASATAMAILLPRWKWVFYGVAAIVAAERVAENAHYLSDTVAGAGVSIIGVHATWRICVRGNKQGCPPL